MMHIHIQIPEKIPLKFNLKKAEIEGAKHGIILKTVLVQPLDMFWI